ncbi:MAG: hypothetical protein DRP82_04690 [Planctomycetota bacterium]|nr:MAG: hypothetical protein DRP82_04690 [Planctomycetota bacterium]
MRAVIALVLVAFVAGCGGSSVPKSSIRKRRKRRRQTVLIPTASPRKSSVTKPGTGQSAETTRSDSGEFIPKQERVPVGASKELWDAWKSFQKDYLNWRQKWDAMLERKESGQDIGEAEIESMLSQTRALQKRMFKVRNLADSLRGKDSLAEGVVHEIDRDAAVNLGRAVQTLLDWRSAGR